jgi:magnesium-transporting ATPase (P-type)
VEFILKNGRACYENSVIIFKYMIIYAIIQLCTYTVLFYSDAALTNNQYLFVDCAVVLVKSILVSKTGPNLKIMKDKTNHSIINLKFMCSIIGQIVIQVTIICCFYFLFFLKNFNFVGNIVVEDINSNPNNEPLSIFNSYLFILTVAQYSATIFFFNHFAKHKKGNSSNKIYIVYTSFIIFFILNLLTINYFNQFANNWNLVVLVRESI